MHDTWKVLGLSRINETSASEGEPPLKSAVSACLTFLLTFPYLLSVATKLRGLLPAGGEQRRLLQWKTWVLLFQSTKIRSRRLCPCTINSWWDLVCPSLIRAASSQGDCPKEMGQMQLPHIGCSVGLWALSTVLLLWISKLILDQII